MKQYAVIHAVAGLFEGYSDTTCEFFPKRGFADKHIKQILNDYRKDEMCVEIDDSDSMNIIVTLTRDYEDYKACVPSDMTHDDWVADNGDDCTVEVFRVIEIDMSNRSGSTESCWLTWDQQDTCPAWDYQPLCMSLVARVASDVMECDPSAYGLEQLTDFISSVYYRSHAFIDIDDYVMHTFRIPKPKESEEPITPIADDLKEWLDTNVNFIS